MLRCIVREIAWLISGGETESGDAVRSWGFCYSGTRYAFQSFIHDANDRSRLFSNDEHEKMQPVLLSGTQGVTPTTVLEF